MKKRLILILLCVLLVLTSCGTPDRDDDDRDHSDNDQEVEESGNGSLSGLFDKDSKEKDDDSTPKGTAEDDDMQRLADMVRTADKMVDFLNQGLELADSYDINMEYMDIKLTDTIINGFYQNYTVMGAGYEREDDNQEYKIYTVTKVSKDGRVYNFLNTQYNYEDRTMENIITDNTYYAESNIFESVGILIEPANHSVDTYLADDGKLFIVGSQIYSDNTLFLEVVYYDGSFIGIARKYIDGANELYIPYDLYTNTPSSWEDMLTEDGYTTIFTYDGANYSYQSNY